MWSFGPCSVSGPYSCRCTDAHRMFRCPSNGPSGALLTTFSSQIRSGQSYTGDYTDGLFSKPSDFRCLGLAGPPVMFSLNPSAGPRVSLTHCFSSSRETVALHPALVRRSAAATPALSLRRRTPRRLLATPRIISFGQNHRRPMTNTSTSSMFLF